MMAGYTVVGVTDIHAGSGSVTVPLPSGTSIGDLIVVAFWPGYGGEVTDARLTPTWRVYGYAQGGGCGVATTLDDVELTFTYPVLAAVITLTDVVGTPLQSTNTVYPVDTAIIPEIAGWNAAVAVVVDITEDYEPPVIGDSADWADIYSAVNAGTGFGLKVYTFQGSDPIPALDVTYGANTLSRGYYLMRLTDPVPSPGTIRRPRIRQRQNHHGTRLVIVPG